MFKRPRTDFWQVGIVPAPIDGLDAQALSALRDRIVWLPSAGPWRYLADPFGLVRGDRLHVFVEAFDHRRKHAVIERHELSLDGLRWLDKQTVLARPFHLSYPCVFEHEGAVYMVPESHQAGEVALYRADETLNRWERQCALLSGLPAADATPVQHQGRWWMFYTLVGPDRRDQRELHLAWSHTLTGPWQVFARNPIQVDLRGARPAGRPYVDATGCLVLPVQDSSEGYGSATRRLRFTALRTDHVAFEMSEERMTGALASADHSAGLHTLSACGALTLLDVKRVDRSRVKQWLDLKRRVGRLGKRLGMAEA